jgi:hypothetical protein
MRTEHEAEIYRTCGEHINHYIINAVLFLFCFVLMFMSTQNFHVEVYVLNI